MTYLSSSVVKLSDSVIFSRTSLTINCWKAVFYSDTIPSSLSSIFSFCNISPSSVTFCANFMSAVSPSESIFPNYC